MVHEKNLNNLSTLYKKWGDQNPFAFQIDGKFVRFSADEILTTNQPNKKQRLWLELFSEMWNLNEDYIFHAEKNGDDATILNDLISKYIQKELGELDND